MSSKTVESPHVSVPLKRKRGPNSGSEDSSVETGPPDPSPPNPPAKTTKADRRRLKREKKKLEKTRSKGKGWAKALFLWEEWNFVDGASQPSLGDLEDRLRGLGVDSQSDYRGEISAAGPSAGPSRKPSPGPSRSRGERRTRGPRKDERGWLEKVLLVQKAPAASNA